MVGCAGSEISDPADYLAWIGDPKHGLVKSQTLQGATVTVRFLPPEYRALQEIRDSRTNALVRDSILKRCGNSLAFLLSIAPNEDAQIRLGSADLDAASSERVADRAMALQFDIQNKIELKVGNRSYRPVLATQDNDQGLNSVRNITLIFIDDTEANTLLHARTYDVVFNDDIYHTGISTFRFDSADIASRVRFDVEGYHE